MKKNSMYLLVLFSTLWFGSGAEAAVIVGRISHVEGAIYRYLNIDKSWMETYRESPVGREDVLATGQDSRAEIVFSNDLLVRLNNSTEIEILDLEEDGGAFVLHSGLARFSNRSSVARLAVETSRGVLRVTPGSVVDLQVDGESVVVAAVSGEATFHANQNGTETVEVITGKTRLELYRGSLVAGSGTIDLEWDRWCGAREGMWARNRRIRSKYLPESMQEYAYVLEPHGAWNRIYFQGHYYWAWKPRYGAAGWAPFTTGYWYNWQNVPVWIDNNPWGWVTHHHGHWINKHGAWMWLPYVHVSPAAGVTVIGFNISIGRSYRPLWHPGRVRWITHKNYIGWLPLAPWETYYGYYRWGPRSVAVHGGGASISIGVNLSHHRYLDHAVVIPKHYLQQRGALVINNYNIVRVRNINKTIIVKNYKPIAIAGNHRVQRQAAKVTGAGKAEIRETVQHKRRAAGTGKVRNPSRKVRKDGVKISTLKKKPKERIVHTSRQNFERRVTTGRVAKRKVGAGKKETQKGAGRAESETRVRRIAKQTKKASAQSKIAGANRQKSAVTVVESRKRSKEPGQIKVQDGKRPGTGRQDRVVAARTKVSGAQKQVLKKSGLSQRQTQRNIERDSGRGKEKRANYADKNAWGADKARSKRAGSQKTARARKELRERVSERQGAGRNRLAVSMNSGRY